MVPPPNEAIVAVQKIKPLKETEFEAIQLLSEQVKKLNEDFKEQKKTTQGVIIGVLIAGFLILVTVAIEVIFYHTRADKESFELQNNYFQQGQKFQEDISAMKLEFTKEISELKNKK